MDIIDCLRERGLIEATTSEELKGVCSKPMKIYIGFDPTADSLHVGSLMGIMVLRWFQKCGHTPVVVLGGATGRIGDPSGKSTERPLLDTATIEENVRGIRKNFENILDFTDPKTKPEFVNNDEWFAGYAFVDFLRDVGKHFRVNVMLTKESVKNRLNSDEGISFTEFSYQLLQAYDFYHLFEKRGVVLQGGGSDQWGNITAGVELVRKLAGKSAYGLTFPLLTRSDGKKFGKTEGGAIWLSDKKTSAYDFYQYFYRVPDQDVVKLMRMLTLMEMDEIRMWEKELGEGEPNRAQKRLAEAMTRLVHGEEGLKLALAATEAAQPGHETVLTVEALRQMMTLLPYVEMGGEEVVGKKFTEVALTARLVTSKGEGARLIAQNGAYLNNKRVESADLKLTEADLIGGEFALLGSGKKKKVLIHIKKT